MRSSLVRKSLSVALAVTCLASWCRADDFPEPPDTEKDAAARPLAAAAAAAGFRATAGLEVQVFAAEPDVRNPIALAWDGRGRLWVAENYSYAGRPTNLEPGLRDRVIVFEDADADGRPDGRHVFHDDLRQLTSVEVGLGGVWLLCPPQLLFVPDADGDARPDGPPRVVLDGFDVAGQNHHNFANGLRFGPDGWLYGRCGGSCPGRVGRPGAAETERVPLAGGVWRYEPRSGGFEAVCHGTTNPWGHDWNAFGDGFFVNTVNGHLWQIIPGAHYARAHTVDPNSYVYEFIDTHADHWHFDVAGGWQNSRDGAANDLGGGHAHSGAMIYLGDDWPSEMRGDLFTWNLHGRRANRERLERRGSGYVARHRPDVLVAADPFFRGIDLSTGPDGAVYALDWSDTGECHEATGVHRSSGRIYRIANRAGGPKRPRPDLPRLATADLLALVTHENEWQVRQARLELARRAGGGPPGPGGAGSSMDEPAIRAALERLVASPDPLVACRAVLAARNGGLVDTAGLRRLLRHEDEHLRAWGVRLIADGWPLDGVHGPLPGARVAADRVAAEWAAVADDFLRLAAADSGGLVHMALASCLQRLPVSLRIDLAAALTTRADDAADRDLPLLVWYGLIPTVESLPTRAADLAIECRWPRTQRLLARRLASLIDRHPEGVGRLVAAIPGCDAATRHNLLAGVADGLAGWRRAPKPEGWDRAVAAVAADPAAAALSRDLSAVFGDGRAIEEIRRLVLDTKADVALRRGALEALVRQGGDLRAICLPLLADRQFNGLAAEGLAGSDDPEVAAALIDSFDRFHGTMRPRLVAVLVSRPSFAAALLDAVEKGRIPATAISPYDIRQIRGFGVPEVTAAVERLYGAGGGTDKRPRIAALKSALTADAVAAADCRRGRALFDRSCGRCHRLFGSGESIGPDLTGGNRTNIDYLLENIVDPSAVVSRDFRMTVVTRKDGRVVNGLVTARDDRTLSIVTPTERLTLALDDVDSTSVTAQSPMPEGLLDQLAPDEIRDLVAYLMQPTQVPPP